MKNKVVFFTLACFFFLSSFTDNLNIGKQPGTITKTKVFVDGKEVERTVLLLDGTTSREELINTCNFLAQENVQLTFDKLTIGKSFLGLVGKQRIRIAEGNIKLSNGSTQSFKAGGVTSFKFLKIQYLNQPTVETSRIEMIEIVD